MATLISASSWEKGVLSELDLHNKGDESGPDPRLSDAIGSALLLEGLVDSAPVAIFVSDPGGRILLCNREAELLFGYSHGELLGQCIEILLPEALHVAHRAARAQYFAQPAARRMGGGATLRARRKDSFEISVEVALKPVYHNNVLLAVSIVIDVSERIAMADALEREKAMLERRVKERTAELERANSEKMLLLADLEQKRADLERLSREDPLTGLPNRRDFDERLTLEMHRAERLESTFSVAIADIDHFKRVNDLYGHALGDTVLRVAARLLQACCRRIDHVSRYGGEEFALILPGMNLDAAASLCERIRAQFENHSWPELRCELFLTVSVGVAEFRSCDDACALMSRADEQLYGAKRAGRNLIFARRD